MCVGGRVRDGHSEKVRESQKQVHYAYKNRLGGMMRKFGWILLVALVFSVYAEDEKVAVVGSADEFKGIESVVVKAGKLIRPKQIIWKKDGAKMRRIPAGPSRLVFCMDSTEVTVGRFKQFVQESGYAYEGN